MHKAATIHARIEPILKGKAEFILCKVGLSAAEAIRLFYTQICLREGLPFPVEIPNKLTQRAMRDAEMRKTKKAVNVDAIFEELS